MKASEIYVGRVPTVGKHKACNNVHLKNVIDRLDAIGETEAADTIVWLLWWRDIVSNREQFLIKYWNEQLDEKVGAAITPPLPEPVDSGRG